jgi:tetratricopeptide (TPR) repeat protein
MYEPIVYIVSISLGIALFFVSDRYRMLLVPVLIVFAAYAIQRLVAFIKERNVKALCVFLLLIPLFILSNLQNETVYANNQREEYYDYYQLGKEYFYKDDYKSALDYFDKSLSINEKNVDSYLFVGYVMAAAGSYDDALSFADKTLSYEPGYQAADLLKAQIYLEQSRTDDARKELYRIINNRQYWFDYTPLYAEKMLRDIESGGSIK